MAVQVVNKTNLDALQLKGVDIVLNSQTIKVYQTDTEGNIVFCTGTVTVTDGGNGYAKGCEYIKTDVATGTGGVYLNKGTKTSCQFTLVTQS